MITYAAVYFFVSAVLSTYIHNEWDYSSGWERWLSCLGYAILSPVLILIHPIISATRECIRKRQKREYIRKRQKR